MAGNKRIFSLLAVLFVLLIVLSGQNVWAQAQTICVSLAPGGGFAGGDSYSPSISADGRYVAFRSYAHNLVPDDTNHAGDVFVYDLLTRVTTRVSVASDGTEGNGSSSGPSISADGRYVAFDSNADNLVPGDTDGHIDDIYMHDRLTGETTMVDVASDGTQASGNSFFPSISADGRYVAFTSLAHNLVSSDFNNCFDVFVHDRLTEETTRVSVASDGTEAVASSSGASISADGRYVAFNSQSVNLISGYLSVYENVFVHDRLTRETTMESFTEGGIEPHGGSTTPAISADGRYVAFQSWAENVWMPDGNYETDSFRRDRWTGETTPVSIADSILQGGDSCSLSSDGRYVAFSSYSDSLVAGDTNGCADVFVRDMRTQTTIRVSVASDGAQANGRCYDPRLSADGRYVAFASYANNLVSGDTNGSVDVFVRGPLYANLLWSHTSGKAGFWTLDADGNRIPSGDKSWGPYKGWAATSYQQLTDGTAKLLWSHASGKAGIWTLDVDGNRIPSGGRSWGPYKGWTATSYQQLTDGTAKLLWSHTSGLAGLWTLDASGNRIPSGDKSWGPYKGWTATSYQQLTDGTAKLLWSHTSGLAGLWVLDANGNRIPSCDKTWKTYSGWTATSYRKLIDGRALLLWSHTSGRAHLWNLDANDNHDPLGDKSWGSHKGWIATSYQ